MSDEQKPAGPNPDPRPHDHEAQVGHAPADVEQMQYGKGPGTPEIHGPGDFAGHPKGLWVLFITEMWERFSYYGMRALLVLYLVASTADLVGEKVNENPGFGWMTDDAYVLYGVYTFMVYVTSIFGGLIADRLLGTHRSMLLGGWVIALGHVTLALTEFFSYEAGSPVTMETGPGALLTFLFGLALIIIGTGFFKPCVSVMVGQLYPEKDPRRDSGFTIFYMGINLGALLSPLIAGTLGETVGWHWGFGAAAVGMIAGLFSYQFLRPRYLKGIGDPPEEKMTPRDRKLVTASLIALLGTPLLPLVILMLGWLDDVLRAWGVFFDAVGTTGVAGIFAGVLVASVLWFLSMQPKEYRSRLGVIFILAIVGNLGFWIAFEQAGTTLNVFAKESTDRTLGGALDEPFPATWYQSVNSLTILVFAPIFGWLWVWLEKRRANPSSPMKFAIGLWLLGLSFIAMVFGALDAQQGGLAAPYWLLITYVVYTWGELCLSPVGLSMVTKLAPRHLQSLMMGLWFFSFALSNLLAGLVAAISVDFLPNPETGEPAEKTFILEGLPGFFLMLVVIPVAVGVLIALMTPTLKKMMRGVK
jgi:POT family proton-dependent oligopeptide transporter